MNIVENLRISDVLRIILKRRYLILGVTIPAVLLAFLFTPEPETTYSASALVEINPPKITSNMSWDYLFTLDEGDNIATQSRILTSQKIIFYTLRKIGLIDSIIQFEDYNQYPEAFNLVSNYKGKVNAEPLRVGRNDVNTNILKISIVTDDRELSINFVNALAEAFREESIKNHNREVNESKKFVEKQLTNYTQKLEQSEKKLLTFVKENLPDFKLQTGSVLDIQVSYGVIKEREKDYVSMKNKLVQRKKGDIKFEDWLSGVNSIANSDKIFSNLIDLENKKSKLLEYQKETSVQVIEIENKIKETIDSILEVINDELTTIINREKETLNLLERSLEYDHYARDVELNESIVSHLSTSLQDVLIQESKEQEPVRIIEFATNAAPITSYRGWTVQLFAALLFPLLTIAIAVAIESQNTALVLVEDVEKFVGLPVLSIIPNINPKDKSHSERVSEIKDQEKLRRLIVHYSPRSIQAEAFRTFRTNLDSILKPMNGKTVMITSSLMGEGKSNALTNLALTYTQMYQRVLLVDCNMRRPTVHRTFGLERKPGLSEILQESVKWQDNVKSIMDMVLGNNVDLDDIMVGPGMENLNIITSGGTSTNPSGLFTTGRFKAFLKEVGKEYDIVFLDTPPLLHVSDATIIAPHADAAAIVYEIGHTSRDGLKRTKAMLDNVNAKILGVVLNDVKAVLDQFAYRSHYFKPYYSESINMKSKAGRGKPGLKNVIGNIDKKNILNNPFSRMKSESREINKKSDA